MISGRDNIAGMAQKPVDMWRVIAALDAPMSETARLSAEKLNARAWTAADYDRAEGILRRSQASNISEARAMEDPQLFEVWAGEYVKEAVQKHVASGQLDRPLGARVIAHWIMLGARAGARELARALQASAPPAYRSAASFGARPTELRELAPGEARQIPAFIVDRAAQLGVSPEEYQAHVYPDRVVYPGRAAPSRASAGPFAMTPALRRHAEAIGLSAEEYQARMSAR